MYKVYLRGEPNRELNFDTPFVVAGLIQQHLQVLQDSSGTKLMEVVRTYDWNARTQLQSILYSLLSNVSVHLTVRAQFSKEPLSYDTKPFLVASAFDTSGLIPTIRVQLSNYGISTAMFTAVNKASDKCIKRGLIPVVLCLGSYHSVKDIQKIDRQAPTIARQTALGIYKFLSSGLFVQKQPRNPKPPVPDECMASLFSDCYTTAWSGSDPDRGIYNSPIVATIAGGKTEYIQR